MALIGLLVADTVDEPFKTRFGGYADMIRRMFARAGVLHHEFKSYEVYRHHYPEHMDECDAYVISGSRRSSYDNESWIERLLDYIRDLHRNRKKTVGICFGHQCIATALGGRVEKSSRGWGVGVHEYNILSREIFPKLASSSMFLQCSHQDQVVELPNVGEPVLESEFCPHAGMKVGDHFLSIQPHPEFCRDFAEYLLRSREDELGKRFSPAMNSLSTKTHANEVSQSLSDFIDAR
ncbi:MAG: GMP synthase [Gammaproteobacteria bacterium]|nr:GMP synthase [Gammaproteobacteria bacterium]